MTTNNKMTKYVPINKGNYSMDTNERDELFEKNKSLGWEEGYKQYRKNWTEYPKNQFVSEYPLLVDLELASICNLKCPMCYTISDNFKKSVNTKRMEFDLFKKVIDQIANKTIAVRLSLRGEATLNKDFAKCIKYAKENGIKEVSTLTHGFKLTIPYFKEIVEAGIDWITVSIDGTGETYNSIRKPLRFNELLEKLRQIKKFKEDNNLKKPVIKVQGIWPAIAKAPQEFYDTFSPIVDQVAFNPLIDYLWNDKEDKIDYIENFTCPQQYQRLVIGADGLVMKCSNDEENKEVIGDANKEKIYDIWHGEKMNKVREIHKKSDATKESDVCKKCYLPRETQNDKCIIDDREITIFNYTKRSQIVGK